MPSSWIPPARFRRVSLTVAATATTALALATASGAAALPSNCSQLESTVTCSFVYTGGEQQFKVPTAVTGVLVEAFGGRGGNSAFAAEGVQSGGFGGLAGTATAPISAFPGETLFVEVGGDGLPGNHGGWNGGGAEANNFRNFPAGAGGGASDVRTVSCGSGCANGGSQGSLASRLVVAGGGGGGAEVGEGEGYDTESSGGDGGDAEGAGTTGHDAETEEPAFGAGGGSGGTESAAGTGGAGGAMLGGSRDGNEGEPGAFGRGGNGGAAFESRQGAGGGGGAGWFGGGGAREGSCCQASAGGGGGGGSSYAPGGATGIDTEGVPTSVTISYEVPVVEATSPVEFATQTEGTLSLPHAVTVTNEGEGALVLSALTFAGADPSDFVIASDSCLGQIEPEESCDVMVAFAPKAEGARTATLEIASNDPSGPATVELEGIGGAPPHGAQGPEGAAGTAGATGVGGSSGPAGPAGPAGATGAAGATGSGGASGHSGTASDLGVMTCRTHASAARASTVDSAPRARAVSRLVCTRSVSNALTLRGEARASHAQLMRGGQIYAAGMIVQSAGGRAQLFLTDRRSVAAGSYTLAVARRQGGRWTTTHRQVTVA